MAQTYRTLYLARRTAMALLQDPGKKVHHMFNLDKNLRFACLDKIQYVCAKCDLQNLDKKIGSGEIGLGYFWVKNLCSERVKPLALNSTGPDFFRRQTFDVKSISSNFQL